MSENRKFRTGELIESLEKINYSLEREYGKQFDHRPTWRVVWSNDPVEKRMVDFDDHGLQLVHPVVREVKKYSYIHERYVLERLVIVAGQTDVVGDYSYEPAWTFEDRFQNYLPPRLDACKLIIEAIYAAAQGKGAFKNLKDESQTPEGQQKQLKEVEDYLFGNETPVTDALAYGYGVTVPGNGETKQ